MQQSEGADVDCPRQGQDLAIPGCSLEYCVRRWTSNDPVERPSVITRMSISPFPQAKRARHRDSANAKHKPPAASLLFPVAIRRTVQARGAAQTHLLSLVRLLPHVDNVCQSLSYDDKAFIDDRLGNLQSFPGGLHVCLCPVSSSGSSSASCGLAIDVCGGRRGRGGWRLLAGRCEARI